MNFTPNRPHDFIVDISHHNDDINFDVARNHVGYFIARTGDGHRVNTNGERQGVLDRKYKMFTDQMSQKGIPFGNYMFNRFSGVASARQEAEDFWKVGNKNATTWVCDAEVSTAPNMLECIQAFVDRLKELGAKKVGLYIGHHKYQEFNGAAVKNIDFVWIPRYGAEPAFACDLWQFTETGNIQGIGKCDINVMLSGKRLDFYTNKGDNNMNENLKEPSDWAKETWKWGIENNIVDGVSEARKPVTEEVAVNMLRRFAERYGIK